jgi:DNA helicase HerA-like ATPase
MASRFLDACRGEFMAQLEARLLGQIAWDGTDATNERVMLRAPVFSRRHVERNQYVRILDEEGGRSGFLARIVSGPFYFRAGAAAGTASLTGSASDNYLLADLEIQGELVGGRSRDTNSRPAPGSSVYALSHKEIADLHGFQGDMLMGNLSGQDDLWVNLQSKNKSVLPRNLGVFGTVGSGKSNTSQVIIEEAARNGWAVVVLDVESEYTEMDQPSAETALHQRLAEFGREPEGIKDFHVYYPASCVSDREGAEPFTLRLADFDTSVIGEILQVSIAERNALYESVEYLMQKARVKMTTSEPGGYQSLLDATPQAKLPFTLLTLRERANERSSRGTEVLDYAGLASKLSWLLNSEAFDQIKLNSLDPIRMLAPGRVSIFDVSVANDIVKNMVTADLLRKIFALKMLKPETPPTMVIIEEAHSFISRERANTMQATLHMLRNITRRGRKRWLSMAFVSQQPGHLPPEIFELCNTRVIHALRSTHNLETLISTTGDVNKALWSRVPLLGQGQAVLSAPQLNRSVVLSIRPAASKRKFTH